MASIKNAVFENIAQRPKGPSIGIFLQENIRVLKYSIFVEPTTPPNLKILN